MQLLTGCVHTAGSECSDAYSDARSTNDRQGAFVKDWNRLSHSGRFDMKRLKEAMLLLVARDAPLGATASPIVRGQFREVGEVKLLAAAAQRSTAPHAGDKSRDKSGEQRGVGGVVFPRRVAP
jgi:hypothetical protein